MVRANTKTKHKNVEVNMITVKRLKKLLEEVPDDAMLWAYEGEDTGISVCYNGKKYWWIRAEKWDDITIDSFVDGFVDDQIYIDTGTIPEGIPIINPTATVEGARGECKMIRQVLLISCPPGFYITACQSGYWDGWHWQIIAIRQGSNSALA